jgi:hypothetical protein
MRKIPSAISCTLVPVCELVIMEALAAEKGGWTSAGRRLTARRDANLLGASGFHHRGWPDH